jgi:NAD(P) transhydrogenase subunit alpha
MCPAKDGVLVVNFEDEVVRGATVVKEGQITWPPPAPKLTAAPAKPAAAAATASGHGHGKTEAPAAKTSAGAYIAGALGLAGLAALGTVAPPAFMAHFIVFVLACFIGYMVVWNVTAALHTPLMSITNAISSIIIIGALLQVSSPTPAIMWIAGLTVLITSINIFGGFAVTRRMLEMFRR